MPARFCEATLYGIAIFLFAIVISARGDYFKGKHLGSRTSQGWGLWRNRFDENDYTEISPPEWNPKQPAWVNEIDKNIRLSNEEFRLLETDGKVSVPHECMQRNQCTGHWGPWQAWSDCNLAVPGNDRPNCHNTLHFRKRHCAGSTICQEINWEFCAHRPSCTGEWTSWSNVGNCSVECSQNQTRNRICMKNNEVTPGLCFESGSTAVQTEIIKCPDGPCGIEMPYNLKLGLILGSGGLLLIFLVAVITSCAMNAKGQTVTQHTSLVSSSSFLLSHWRIISRRFTRQTYSEPGRQDHHEVAIGSNYSAVHIYESPNDYAQVQDTTERNLYEEASGIYRSPYDNGESKLRRNTTASEDKYAEIGAVGPYTSMKSLNNPKESKIKEFRRAQSCDNIAIADKNINRSRPLPGQTVRGPCYRGASQFSTKKSKGVTKTPSYIGSKSGVVARITKKKRVANEQIRARSNISRGVSSESFNLQEDHYGYLVPNGSGSTAGLMPIKKKTKTFSGIDNSPSIYDEQSLKSSSLPIDINTYVTMKGFKKV